MDDGNRKIKLSDLIKPVGDARLYGIGDIDILGIEYDSRRIKPGMLFAAISGYTMDGRKFIPQAIENGAVAVLTDTLIELNIPVVVVANIRKALADVAAHFYGYPGQKLKTIGITGTNGKSTSVIVIQKILSQAGIKTGMINSLFYNTGIKEYKAERTTPDSVDMQKYLFEMVNAGCTHAVIEVSSHALILSRVDNINFEIGLFTNISRDHLDFHKSMNEYIAAKKSFLDRLVGDNKAVIANADAPEFESFLTVARCRTATYGLENKKADFRAENITFQAGKTSFDLLWPPGRINLEINLPGRYNLYNVLGAAATGYVSGIDANKIVEALKSTEPVPGRFQPINVGQPFAVILDYAHTPDAIERLCKSAREITDGKILILFGCGGDRDRGKRPLMAEAASNNADFVILTSDNPRSEDPQKIINDAVEGIVGDNYLVEPDRREAIKTIIGKAVPGDTVLIAGKGAEDYQEIGGKRYPFCDFKEAVDRLKALGYGKAKT